MLDLSIRVAQSFQPNRLPKKQQFSAKKRFEHIGLLFSAGHLQWTYLMALKSYSHLLQQSAFSAIDCQRRDRKIPISLQKWNCLPQMLAENAVMWMSLYWGTTWLRGRMSKSSFSVNYGSVGYGHKDFIVQTFGAACILDRERKR